MELETIIIADFNVESLSVSNRLRFSIEGRTADIQLIKNFINNKGKIVSPIVGDGYMSWASAPRLNGITLLSYLNSYGIEVGLINDFYSEKEKFNSLLSKNPKSIIISTSFIYSKSDLQLLVDEIKSLAPDLPIIVGGPFVYTSFLIQSRANEKLYNSKQVAGDYLFVGEDNIPVDIYIISSRGEDILIEVLERIKKKQDLKNIPNTAIIDSSGYRFEKRVDDISGHKEHSIDWESLPDSIFGSGVVPMQASSGCPHHCAFCNFVKDRRLTYTKPLDQLVSEMKSVQKRGAKYIWFVDDNFRLGAKDLERVCRRFIAEGLQIKWMTFIRADSIKDADFKLIKEAGCEELRLGLESADLSVLKNMNKKANPELYSEVIKNLLAAGINCSAYFIFGHPGETSHSAEKSIEFIKSLEHPELPGVFSWSMYPFMLAPLSPIYEADMRKEFQLDGYMASWEHKTMNSKEAKGYIQKAFFDLENSGPIYRGDNQEMLQKLTASQRKEFDSVRHKLGKMSLKTKLKNQIIIDSFASLFN